MFMFTLGIILLLVGVLGIIGVLTVEDFYEGAVKNIVSSILIFVGMIAVVASTALYVPSDSTGIIEKKFGKNMPVGQIIAIHGEKGPQAQILGPGWNFGYWPWLFDLSRVKNIVVPEGKVGLIEASDGTALESGQIYAPVWDDPRKMLDAVHFLTSGQGRKGPQLTVLSPGEYRYNPRLYTIRIADALKIPVGYAAAVKDNAGENYTGQGLESVDGVPAEVETVNGVPLVPNGYRGIWKTPLLPNTYYMHPLAYDIILVKTTKRVYNYTAEDEGDKGNEDNSVLVKTADGYKFPVDTRVGVKIVAENVPYVVALLGDPDKLLGKSGFDVLEEKAILPSILSIFRNTAEKKSALEYLNSRSAIEQDATLAFTADMTEFKIEVDKVYVADIGLDRTEEGKALLKTQTDKQLAKQQIDTFQEQKQAEDQRALMVRANELANQESKLAAAEAQKRISLDEGEAAANRAKGDAAAYAEKIKAVGGFEFYQRLLMLETLKEIAPSIQLPTTLVIGQGQALQDALFTNILKEQSAK